MKYMHLYSSLIYKKLVVLLSLKNKLENVYVLNVNDMYSMSMKNNNNKSMNSV